MQLEELVIDGAISTLDAMRRLDETGRRILFIAPQGRLAAVLTDSDVRRFILKGGELSRPVAEAANHAPKSLPVAQRGQAREFMQKNSIEAVPLLDTDGCLADVVFLNDLGEVAPRKTLSVPVVIMAGGLGTRLYPYTKILPKPLIPVGDVPIIELVIGKFADFGCRGFTLVVNYKKNMIKSYFADMEKDYTVTYAEEEAPLGTGGGLCLLKGKVRETFFLTNCDSLVSADYGDLLKHHKKEGNAITMVCVMKDFVLPYGVVELGEDGRLKEMAEKPHMNFLTNAGLYVVEPHVLAQVEDGVCQDFPDIIAASCARGERVGIYPVADTSWMDMGQLEELDEMRRRLEQGQVL